MIRADLEAVPRALTARDQWVCWRRQERDGKPTKVPVDPATGGFASTTDPETWARFEDAQDALQAVEADGIGFVFTDDDPLVGVDLDDCREPSTRTIEEWARDVVTRLDSYAEVSPSGTGVHVIVTGELPAGRSRTGDVEIYETGRFFTVTGAHLDRTPPEVQQREEAIREVHREFVQEPAADAGEATSDASGSTEPRAGLASEQAGKGVDLSDEELLARARDAANGDRFNALWRGQTTGYDSHSEADMALCLHLAFWTGGDPGRMDRLFRESGLMREKWDEVHYADGATYGERTIERALEVVDEVYDPDRDSERNAAATHSSGVATESSSKSQEFPVVRGSGTESVYLEERNRLLREKVQSQAATLERQRERIAQLEAELQAVGDQLAITYEPQSDSAGDGGSRSRFWRWLRKR